MLGVVVELAADELDRVLERIAGRFARAEPRARARRYVAGLVAGLERKNGWTLAELAGEVSPDGGTGRRRLARTMAGRTRTPRLSTASRPPLRRRLGDRERYGGVEYYL